MNAINQGALDITGIQAQGIRRMFGGMNEIDTSKALVANNLMRLAKKHNFNADAVLAEIHQTYTKRTGIDPAVREFVEKYRKVTLGR